MEEEAVEARPTCELEGEGRPCESDGATGRSAFILSDDALQRLTSFNDGPKSPTTWKIFEKHEKTWRHKEKWVEQQHAKKVGIDEASLNRLEKSLYDSAGECKNVTELGRPVRECYDVNYRTPLKCRCQVVDYCKSIAQYRDTLYLDKS